MPSFIRRCPLADHCHLCGYLLDRRPARTQHPMLKPTADHVKPRAHFGENTRANLLPAHWFCNNRRGDMPVTEDVKKWLAAQVAEKFSAEILELERLRKKVAWWET